MSEMTIDKMIINVTNGKGVVYGGYLTEDSIIQLGEMIKSCIDLGCSSNLSNYEDGYQRAMDSVKANLTKKGLLPPTTKGDRVCFQ